MKKLFLFFALVLTVGMNAWAQDADYLCFTAEENEAYFQLYKYGEPTNVTLEYSTNGGSSWTDYTFTAADGYEYGYLIRLQNAGDKVYFRNKSNNVTNFSTSTEDYYRFSIHNNKISVSGNVMSLVDKRCATTTIPNNYCFARLFEYCTSITSAPKLPATELKEGCYNRMFTGCNNLTNAPTLPARILKSYCYYEMFEGCTSLSHVEVGFTEWDPSGTTDALRWWMQDVSQTGTFECPKDLNTSSRSNYIPEGWTISQYMPDYLCFTTEKDASICLEKEGSPTAVTIEYSKNGMEWNTLTLYKYVELQSGETLYLRNASETVTEFSKGGRDYYHFRLSSSDDSNRISASGNIMSLVDKSCNTKTIPCNYCFYELFSGNRNLTSAPKLPATTLAIECYENMFEDCTGLTEAPALPATSLSYACYSNMFSGCTGLVNAPELAATTLAEGCYRSMFQGCTGLTVAPELPATTLVRGCYENMFGDCTGLTEAPELPAPTLVEKCYYGMFDNCSNLRKVSVSFKEWFKLDKNGATAGWLDDVAEEGEFICPPGLPKLTGSSSYIPENWTVKAPDYLCFTANTTSSRVSLSKVGSPADVALEFSKDASVWKPYTFGTEISLSPGASVYFRNPSRTPTAFSTDGANYYHFSVEGDVAPSGNIMTLVEKSGSIKEIPDGYVGLFYGLFSGCTGLTAAPELPATTLTRDCYYGMFSGCTSLTSAPELPATKLGTNCYKKMFKDCSNLNYIKVGFSQWHENATRDWVSGVAAKGIFDSPVELDKTKVGTSYLPAGWTQVKVIYHPTKEPTYQTVGYTQDCWEDRATGKFYSDKDLKNEIDPGKVVTYTKFKSNPFVTNNGFTLKEDATYDGVQFNWAAEALYSKFDTGARSVEFTVYGTDVDNARLKWIKWSDDEYRYANRLASGYYGQFTITIYVNGKTVYSVNQDNYQDLVGLFAVPLPELKSGDIVKFVVNKPYESTWDSNPFLIIIAACLEYTSSNGGGVEYIHHDVAQPTNTTIGYKQECWEERTTGKFYSDVECTKELNPAVVTYQKLMSDPVAAYNGFTLVENATYENAQFDWAAKTTYERKETGTRYVEFAVYGTDVDNARLKLAKNYNAAGYGSFIITVYVNGKKEYSIDQGNNALGGVLAIPLPYLKSGDKVKFEVNKPNIADFADAKPTITVCLEYTSSNGGKGNVVVKAVDKQKFLGETDPALTYTTYPANIELSGINLTRDEGEELGEYVIHISEDEGANPDYNITFAEGKFTISKSPITITADSKAKLAGDADPELTWSVKGKLIEGHDLTDIIISREKGEETGTYSIYASQANDANPYYDITFVDGTLVIADANLPIYHGAAEPTYRTLGYTQNCWEDPTTGKIYSDVLFENELDQTKVITYSRLISNPVTAKSGFALKDSATYYGVKYNWVAETTFAMRSVNDTRSVEFTVLDKEVDDVRIKWAKDHGNCDCGSFAITIYVNGKNVYSINQGNTNLEGTFALPLPGLKIGDVVRFQVYKQYISSLDGGVTIAACLEYTFNKDIVSVTADNKYKVIGDKDPELTWQITTGSLAEGDELTGIKIWREEGENVGSYPIHVSQEEGANAKYNLQFDDATLEIIDAVHHEAAEPTYTTVGNIEYWSSNVNGKDYYNIQCTQEANPAKIFTYKKLISNPVTSNNGFTIKDATYDGVQFNWVAETLYGEWEEDTRTVEFTVYGTDVANGRLKWYKDHPLSSDGEFVITVYVNGTQVYSQYQEWNNLGGLFAVPLQGLKTGDVVSFQVHKRFNGKSTVTVAACLEYTSSNGGRGVTITADNIQKQKGEEDPELTWSIADGTLAEGDKLTGIKIWREEGEDAGRYPIHVSQEKGANPTYYTVFVDGTFTINGIAHHEKTEPTYRTVGYSRECWEKIPTGKYYSDAECTKELAPAQVITYKKFISNPVTANIESKFTLKDATIDGVQFNWAAVTTYDRIGDQDLRKVEFTVYGTDVADAQLKWIKTVADAQYGRFIIDVYVNDHLVYQIDQLGEESVGGLFTIPLPGLKSGDKVVFKVTKETLYLMDNYNPPTIAACLEYTSSNGGLNGGELITANQDPDHKQNYYSTFYSSWNTYQVPKGVTAYTGAVDGNVLKLTAIEDNIIPADVAVILRMTTEDNSATKKQITLYETTATGTWSGENELKGTNVATTLGENDYALSLGQHGVGFYLWEGKSIGAHKAYLTLPSSFGAKAFTFQFDDDPTGIESLTPALSEGEGAAYNLNGVRVDDSYKGIVIKNGKKIYQK